jgi:L-ascorbate metabolism protein UlaG (beta-lactamase superfamily)
MRQGIYHNAKITALGHDGFVVEYPDFALAFDPYDVKDVEGVSVDFVFVTHPHFDHCDPSAIRKILKPQGRVVAPPACQEELKDFGEQLEIFEGKDKRQADNFKYWSVPAYNIDKFRTPSEVFHPPAKGFVGWVVEVGSTRWYHAGDTDLTPEMEALKKIDVAFLPISGTFVMTLDEAVKAAEILKPDVVIPMHFGKLLGSVSDAHRFGHMLKDQVKVLALSTES